MALHRKSPKTPVGGHLVVYTLKYRVRVGRFFFVMAVGVYNLS
jgi:hypothetical protein